MATTVVTASFVLQTVSVVVLALAVIKVYEAIARLLARSRVRKKDVESPSSPVVKPLVDGKDDLPQTTPEPEPEPEHDNAQLEEMQLHKDLYFKLQNLEQHPHIMSQCWDLLVSLLNETLADALKQPGQGILSVEHYTRMNLSNFLQSSVDETTQQWEQYVVGRKAGSPREMFGDREEAKWWLKQAAPVKYVDGAWLGHINKITTPFALRHITKNAWQVMSEELGDGDLSKNHVHVYRDLMKEIDSGLPDGDSVEFIHPRHELNEPRVWKAAIAQLLISLFPHDFLPEILGFNMAYEGLPLHLMKTVKELEELKLNAYYFVLHISIDNADSGHAAMAMEAAIGYIEHQRETHGGAAAQQAWKRVQAGFILAEGLPTTPQSPSLKRPTESGFPWTDAEAEVVEIFRAKAAVAHKIHCNSRLKIGRHSLVDWLEPKAFSEKKWQMDFLHDLGNCKPWVVKGNNEKSRLIRELSWEGKMFGSFTQTEVEVVKRWIDSLGNSGLDPHLYWRYVGREEITSHQIPDRTEDIRCDYPVFTDHELLTALESFHQGYLYQQPVTPPGNLTPPAFSLINIHISRFIPLWFAHPCVLESFVTIPFKTANKTGSAIVRLLRAQYGFEPEGPGVAGMDEVRRTDAIGLVELGLEIVRNASLPGPRDLREALQDKHEDFAQLLLHLSMRPMQYMDLLLGLSYAFVELHEAVAQSDLLCSTSQAVLQEVARRERQNFTVCLAEIKADDARYAEFYKGYNLGGAGIRNCVNER